jgi:hypothetical protein
MRKRGSSPNSLASGKISEPCMLITKPGRMPQQHPSPVFFARDRQFSGEVGQADIGRSLSGRVVLTGGLIGTTVEELREFALCT